MEKTEELEALERRAGEIHARAVVVDTHSDTPLQMSDPDWNFMERPDEGHMDLPRIREGGLDAVFLAVYLDQQKPGDREDVAVKAMTVIDRIRRLVEENPHELTLATTAEEVRRCAERGRTAVLIGIEGGHIIDNRLELLRCYHRLGARYMTLTHSFHHDWADSSGIDEILDSGQGGLSAFGREVIQEMNRIGMMIDISHVSDDTFWDVYETSRAPLIATHSGVRALAPHRRNMSDEMIQALARRGGVVQVVFYPGFIDPGYEEKRTKAKQKRALQEEIIRKQEAERPERVKELLQRLPEEIPVESTPLSLLIDHIEYIASLVGADHVGLGADWDGVGVLPEGMEDCSKVPRISVELLKRGFNEQDIRKILGENVLRVMEETAWVAEKT